MKAIDCKNVSVTLDGYEVLKGIDLEVEVGGWTTIVGPNGAGKTTLMKIITSILKQDSGTITINGYNTQTNKISTKRQTVSYTHLTLPTKA